MDTSAVAADWVVGAASLASSWSGGGTGVTPAAASMASRAWTAGAESRQGRGQAPGRHQAGGGDRDEPLHVRGEPDDADATQALLGGHAEAGEGQAEERLGRVGDCNLLHWRDAHAIRGFVKETILPRAHLRGRGNTLLILNAPGPADATGGGTPLCFGPGTTNHAQSVPPLFIPLSGPRPYCLCALTVYLDQISAFGCSPIVYVPLRAWQLFGSTLVLGECVTFAAMRRSRSHQWMVEKGSTQMSSWHHEYGLEEPFLTGVGHECSAPIVSAEDAVVRRPTRRPLRSVGAGQAPALRARPGGRRLLAPGHRPLQAVRQLRALWLPLVARPRLRLGLGRPGRGRGRAPGPAPDRRLPPLRHPTTNAMP